jgi:hypothetical protein
MNSSDITISSASKMFEYEKMSREIEACNDLDTLKEMLRLQIKMYMKLQETVPRI